MRVFRFVAMGLLAASAPWATVAAGQVTAPAAAPRAASGERLQAVGRMLQDYVDRGRIAGAVVEVRQDGRTVYSTAVGWRDREARDPMRADTIFRIASQTKALTSVAAMMLAEEGRLLLSDPVGKYLPEWKATTVAVPRADGGYDTVPAKRPITIRDLMTHTAGISYATGPARKAWNDAGFQGWYWADRDEPVAAAVARMGALPMTAQPGERFVYGYATDVLGAVVEQVSGKPLDAVLDERLIRPLEMRDTFFYAPADKAGRLATVYSAGEGGKLTRAAAPGAWTNGTLVGQGHYAAGPRRAFSGGAGLLSTAGDYSRFLEMLRRGGTLDGRRYLSRHAVELMTANNLVDAPYDPGMGFGLGFAVRDDVGKAGAPGSKGEYGWGGAYHSTYWVDPAERLTVVYMTQALPAGDLDDHGKLRALIYAALD